MGKPTRVRSIPGMIEPTNMSTKISEAEGELKARFQVKRTACYGVGWNTVPTRGERATSSMRSW